MGNPLDIRTYLTQIHEALVDAIDLAFRHRYPEAATLADLSAVDAAKLPDRALIFVATEGVVYRLNKASQAPVLSPYVVAPLVVPTEGNGRWLRQTSALTLGPNHRKPLHRVRSGYLKACQIYQGEDGDQLERIYGQRPAVLVKCEGDEMEVSSWAHGGLYNVEPRFLLHIVANNNRADASAITGSVTESDSGTLPDPGIYRMVGDLRYLLAGSTLGLSPGVKFVDIQGGFEIVESSLSQRLFIAEMEIVVKGSVHIMDEDLEESPSICIERRDAGTADGEPFDPLNYVAQGYKIAPQTGFVAAPIQGAAYVGGLLVSAIPSLHTFPADSDTYRDLLPTGEFVYQSVSSNYIAPSVVSGALRVGLTVTDANGIISDRYLSSYSVPSGANPGDPFKAI